MILHIDTTQGHNIFISIKQRNKIIITKEFRAEFSQAESLLVEIDEMLKRKRLKLTMIKSIKVANKDGFFTALRIGVIVANSLGYALGVSVEGDDNTGRKVVKGESNNKIYIVKPLYSKEPNITI